MQQQHVLPPRAIQKPWVGQRNKQKCHEVQRIHPCNAIDIKTAQRTWRQQCSPAVVVVGKHKARQHEEYGDAHASTGEKLSYRSRCITTRHIVIKNNCQGSEPPQPSESVYLLSERGCEFAACGVAQDRSGAAAGRTAVATYVARTCALHVGRAARRADCASFCWSGCCCV